MKPVHVTAEKSKATTPPLDPAIAGWVKLNSDLRAVASTSESREQLVNLFLELAVLQSPLLCAAWLQAPIGKQPAIAESKFSNSKLDNINVRNQIIEASKRAIDLRTPQVVSSRKVRGAAVISVPFYFDDSKTAVLCGLVHESSQNKSDGLRVCQMIVAHFDLWRARDEMTHLAFEIRSAATVLELIEKAQETKTVRNACYVIANHLKDLFRCDYVAVGLRKGKQRSCRLMALSAISEFDTESRLTLLFRSAFDEAVMRNTYTVFPAQLSDQRNSTLSHKKLAKQMRCEAAITVPVRNQLEEIIGAVTIVGNRHLDRNPATGNLIRALEHPLGSTIEAIKYAEGGLFRKATRFLICPSRTKMVVACWVLALAALAAMFVPVPYRVHCQCVAEPVLRRVSVAPYDGLLENTFVEPGDLVTEGQLLARMDGREIRFELAGIEADKTRAIKKRDTHQANHEIPEALMADLERARLEEKTKLLKHRERNFEIVSPVNGIVLSGSIDRRENFPVTLGESLFEIAPIDPLRVELAVPADEIMNIKQGQSVKFRFDGFGTQTVEGVVSRTRPSTTIRNDQNVFIAEAILNNETGTVRPGMEGNARIFGTNRKLGWCLLHQPWEKIVTAVGF